MSTLLELTHVMLATPGPQASDDEIAAWYERKAALFEHIGAAGGPDAAAAHDQAALAHQHSARLSRRTPR